MNKKQIQRENYIGNLGSQVIEDLGCQGECGVCGPGVLSGMLELGGAKFQVVYCLWNKPESVSACGGGSR